MTPPPDAARRLAEALARDLSGGWCADHNAEERDMLIAFLDERIRRSDLGRAGEAVEALEGLVVATDVLLVEHAHTFRVRDNLRPSQPNLACDPTLTEAILGAVAAARSGGG
jgi:hypothetical protein